MNRARVFITIAVAVVLGFLVSVYVYRQLQHAASVRPVQVSTVKVVVAAARLPLGTNLQETNLKYIAWPEGAPMNGMFTRTQDIVGRTLISKMEENEPVLEGNLASRGVAGGLSATIPDGMRAVSVAVNDVVGVAGFVVPGTVVDVLVTGSAQNSTQKLTRTILQDVRVLAAGQKIDQDKQGQPETVPVVTLLVTPEQANTLALASTQGKIQLALRNTVDSKNADPPDVYEAALFGNGVPVPRHIAKGGKVTSPPPPPSLFTVEVIRAGKKETTTFPNATETNR